MIAAIAEISLTPLAAGSAVDHDAIEPTTASTHAVRRHQISLFRSAAPVTRNRCEAIGDPAVFIGQRHLRLASPYRSPRRQAYRVQAARRPRVDRVPFCSASRTATMPRVTSKRASLGFQRGRQLFHVVDADG